MLTVACVWVRANVPYSPDYVSRLKGMVERNLARPHRFVCLTEQPGHRLPKGIDPVPIPSPGRMFGWWSKLELFKAGRFSGRVLYLDLDTLIVGPLDPIVDFASPFALIPNAGNFQCATRTLVKRFNSSVMVWDAGVNTELHTNFMPAVAKRLHGDQDWIGEQRPDADKMPLEWFPRLSEIQAGPVPTDARVVLAKTPKPAEAAQRWPWVEHTWRAA